MNQREKMLAAMVAAVLALFAGKMLYGSYQGALEKRENALADGQKQLMALDRKLAQGRAAVRQIQDWQTQSLPEDREQALTLYKAWLLEKAKDAGLQVNDINPATRPTASTAYSAIGYQIKGTGSLTSVVSMLYEFYRSPQLHQITRLQMDRPQGGSQINVQLDVEALSLPGAEATDKLPQGETTRLRLARLDEYKKTFDERDIVTVYKPPRPPREATASRPTPPAPPKFDDAEQARFSGSIDSAGGLQAWVHVQTTGETLRLKVGDDLKVGALDAKVTAVENFALIYETDGKKFRVPLGKFLREGKEVLNEPANAADETERESPS